MVSYETDIANLALLRLGEGALSLDGTIASLTSGSVSVDALKELYPKARDFVLQKENWDCVTRRELLTRAGKVAITSITSASPAVVAASGHGFEEGDLISIESVVGMTEVNTEPFVCTSVSSAVSFKLYDVEGDKVDASAYTAYTSGGYAYHYPTDDWDYVYDMPSDCLKVLAVLDNAFSSSTHIPWKRTARRIYTNQEYAGLKFIKQETTVSRYDPELVTCMVAYLAYLLSFRLTKAGVSSQELFTEWKLALLDAKGDDAEGSTDGDQPEALWTTKR